jgi:hypothetical protein
MILIQKILFNQQECQSIIDITKLKKQNWNYKDRIYESMSIEYNENTIWLFDKLKDFVEKETNIKIGIIKKTIHFHRFVKGDWFGKHNDIRNNRLYAVGVLLNDDFEGGDFKLYNPNEITLDKVIGNTYLFDVKIDHEITSILEGERYSLLWFLQNEHIKIPTNTLI